MKTDPNYFAGIRERINSKYIDRIRIENTIELYIEGIGRNTNGLIRYTEIIENYSSKYYGHIWMILRITNLTVQSNRQMIMHMRLDGQMK